MRLPTDLDVVGRRIVVCGGSAVSLATITDLVADRAAVEVIADEVPATIAELADRGALTWTRRGWQAGDLDQAALVVAAGPPDLVSDVRRAAADRGLLCAVLPAPTDHTVDRTGTVVLVGGGPGDPGLLTVAGLAAIREADVIITDRLAPLAALAEARPGTEIIDVAKIPRGRFTPQERINELLVEHARAGRTVVRLKGGDSFVFGRGGEEWQACAAAGVPVRVVPGVSSAVAGPALAGIPLTHRTMTQGFTVVTGHLPPGEEGSTLDWAALAATNTTLVIMMGVATLPAITAELLRQGLAGTTPAVTVADAGLPGQHEARGTLADIADRTAAAGIRPPAITVIGAVAGFDPRHRG